jgi:hypothetical protein
MFRCQTSKAASSRRTPKSQGSFLLLIFPVDEAAGFTDQHLLAFRTGDFRVGLIDTGVRFAAARADGMTTCLADERLFAKAALEHG